VTALVLSQSLIDDLVDGKAGKSLFGGHDASHGVHDAGLRLPKTIIFFSTTRSAQWILFYFSRENARNRQNANSVPGIIAPSLTRIGDFALNGPGLLPFAAAHGRRPAPRKLSSERPLSTVPDYHPPWSP